MRYFYGDYVASSKFIMRSLDMRQNELARETGYAPPYLSGLLNRRQYSPEAEMHIMETLHELLPPAEQPPFSKPKSTFYHLRLSSRSRDTPEAVDIDCCGDIICLIKFVMSSYGVTKEELAACIECSPHTVQKMLERQILHPSVKQQEKIEAGIQRYFQEHGNACGALCGHARYVVGIQKRYYDTSIRRNSIMRNEELQ